MIKNRSFNNKLVETLREACGGNSDVAQTISDILDIDKVSAYRRINGHTRFSMDEIVLLATEFNISIDRVINEVTNRSRDGIPFEMRIISPGRNIALEYYEGFCVWFCKIAQEPGSEIGGALTALPWQFVMDCRVLASFIAFKWNHYHSDDKSFGAFCGEEIPESIWLAITMMAPYYKHVKRTTYIWDDTIIPDLIKDIGYFRSLGLVRQEDAVAIKGELCRMLDQLETLVTIGGYPETGNRFELYRSSVSLGASQIYCTSASDHYGVMCEFTSVLMQSRDKRACGNIKKWVDSVKKSATLISGSCEKERMMFLKDQREIVNCL